MTLTGREMGVLKLVCGRKCGLYYRVRICRRCRDRRKRKGHGDEEGEEEEEERREADRREGRVNQSVAQGIRRR
jgi:hypothetical protein